MRVGRLNAGERLCVLAALLSALFCAWIAAGVRDRDTDPFSAELHAGSAR